MALTVVPTYLTNQKLRIFSLLYHKMTADWMKIAAKIGNNSGVSQCADEEWSGVGERIEGIIKASGSPHKTSDILYIGLDCRNHRTNAVSV